MEHACWSMSAKKSERCGTNALNNTGIGFDTRLEEGEEALERGVYGGSGSVFGGGCRGRR